MLTEKKGTIGVGDFLGGWNVPHLRRDLLAQVPSLIEKTHNILQSPENCQKRHNITLNIAYIIFYIRGC
jgi:hypothetical protein